MHSLHLKISRLPHENIEPCEEMTILGAKKNLENLPLLYEHVVLEINRNFLLLVGGCWQSALDIFGICQIIISWFKMLCLI